MRQKILTSLIIIVLIMLILPLQSIASLTNKEKGYISISTTENMELAPDTADITFAVKTTDAKSLQKATNDNKEISNSLYTMLSNMLNVSNGDYIKTSNFNAAPIYAYNNGKKIFDTYEVTNRVIVHTKNIEKIGEMIDKSIKLGATNIDSLNLSISNYDAQCDTLIQIATKKALSRATIIANAASSRIDRVKSLDTSCGVNNYSAPRMYLAKNMIATGVDEMSDNYITSISTGLIKINAHVNAHFFVK